MRLGQTARQRWAFRKARDLLGSWAIRMLTYDRHGELAECEAIVKELGFNAGDAVMRRADKVAATISGFTQSHVILRIESGLISGTAKVLAKSFSKKEWTHCAAKKEVEEVQEPGALIKGSCACFQFAFFIPFVGGVGISFGQLELAGALAAPDWQPCGVWSAVSQGQDHCCVAAGRAQALGHLAALDHPG